MHYHKPDVTTGAWSLVLLALVWGCGGGGGGGSSDSDTTAAATAPTLTHYQVSNEDKTAITSGATSVSVGDVLSTSTIDLFFSTAVTKASIDSGVTMTCTGDDSGDPNAITLTATPATTDATSDTQFTLTPSGGIPQKDSCTVTVGTGVATAAVHVKSTLAAAVAFTLTTACEASDTFTNAVTITTAGCWTAGDANSLITASVNEANGTLAMEMGAAAELSEETSTFAGYKKTLTSQTTMSATFSAAIGLTDPALLEGDEQDELGIFMTNATTSALANCTLMPRSEGGIQVELSGEGGAQAVAKTLTTAGTALSKSVVLKLVRTGTNFKCSYDDGNTGAFTQVSDTGITIDLGSTVVGGLLIANKSGSAAVTATIDDVTFE
jgi:hypothetical protein